MVVRCEEVWREISNYVDGLVDQSLRAAMEAHIAGCAKCKAVLDGTRNVVSLFGDDRMYPLPLGFSSRLRGKLDEQVSPQRGGVRGWMVAFAAAALAIGTFAVGNSAAFIKSPVRSEHAQPGVHVPPQMMVVVAEAGKTFHVRGCKFIHDKTVRSLSAEEAMKEGYTPCIRCMGKYLSASALWVPRPFLSNTSSRQNARN
jgi:anti-sigma factor RsiW